MWSSPTTGTWWPSSRARTRKGDAEVVYPVAEIAYFHERKMTERWASMDAVPADVAAFFSARGHAMSRGGLWSVPACRLGWPLPTSHLRGLVGWLGPMFNPGVVGRIVLLGKPYVEGGDACARLAGRKPWGLLTYLCLRKEVTRADLADLLFSAVEDPAAALRWSLLQTRRGISGIATITEHDGGLRFVPSPDVTVDLLRVLSGDLSLEEAKTIRSSELLQGFAFNDQPGFEGWLLLERRRIAAATVEALAGAASAMIHSEPDAALAMVAQATRVDPFNDSLHELAVEIHVARGDRGGAEAWLRHAAGIYRNELAEALPETVRRPLDRTPPAPAQPLIRLDVTARALLDSAQARFDAGDYRGGVELARRAGADAATSGDRVLEARALIALAGILIHSLRGHDREAVGLLRRALNLARRLDRPELIADAEREIGYVAFLDGRYGAAEQALRRSVAATETTGDAAPSARALIYHALCESDRCDYGAAEATFELALARVPPDEAALAAYGLAGLARLQVRMNRLAEGAENGRVATEAARKAGAVAIVPWALAWSAEASFLLGDATTAEALYSEAFALGCEIGDPCWEVLALRGLALLAHDAGRIQQAKNLLADAIVRCRRLPDAYKWTEALVLTDLLEVDPAVRDVELAHALELTTAGPMPDLYARLQNLPRLQTRSQTPRP